MVSQIYSVVYISPRVDLAENIEMGWFCMFQSFSVGYPTNDMTISLVFPLRLVSAIFILNHREYLF